VRNLLALEKCQGAMDIFLLLNGPTSGDARRHLCSVLFLAPYKTVFFWENWIGRERRNGEK